jgi:hypothetical protein
VRRGDRNSIICVDGAGCGDMTLDSCGILVERMRAPLVEQEFRKVGICDRQVF